MGRVKIFKDEPYTFEHWKRQHTARRYLSPLSCARMVFEVFWPMLAVTISSVAIGLYKEIAVGKHGAPWFAEGTNAVEFGLPFSTTSFAVALLLVFRTNESYRRWWDARRCAGRLCTSMRNLVRQAMAWFDNEPLFQGMARWCIALPHMMLVHVCDRDPNDIVTIMENILQKDEIDFLIRQQRPTFGAAACMTHIVHMAKLPYEQQAAMDQDIRAAMQEFGQSDDLLRQPLPTSYTSHTSRFLLVWLLFLPLAIWEVYGWATPFISAFLAFFLLGIENIAIQIEEPFSRLPLDKIAHRLHLDIDEMRRHLEDGKQVQDL
ncbi:hypothetical protein WJX73_010427 [Symbiochloris irregularis]|uniref:Uncharacterized protein n=1 Tax=Symbiochloris irregularis TaxID=706552 RepID=A0AAW1P9D8_9CHLO